MCKVNINNKQVTIKYYKNVSKRIITITITKMVDNNNSNKNNKIDAELIIL